MRAVGFDFGQTLAELDFEFVQQRLSERGHAFNPASAAAKAKRAWEIYGEMKSAGHVIGWRAMMQAQLEHGGVPQAAAKDLAGWLWDEQPTQNLWRKPIAGMFELVLDLKARGVPVAIISNSEGHLAELVEELGWSHGFDTVVDSGRVGIDKPDPRIFQHACERLGVAASDLLHVGDAWEADVQGALGAGASAVWFDSQHARRVLPPRVYGSGSAPELREVLARLELLS